MNNNVVIVESPAKCKTIEKYLGSDYTVLASFGHIRDLPSKDGSVLPEEDFAMKYQISTSSTKHVKNIVDAMKGANRLILATDPDREGEAISWHVLEVLRKKKVIKKDTKVERVSFSSITKKAVTEAMANPREIDMNLVNSQQARRALDYLVGFNLSPVLWRKLPGSRSAGRVQSVALRLISEREGDIEKFITKEYWDIKVDFKSAKNDPFTATLTHLEGKRLDKFDLNNEGDSTKIAADLADKSYKIAKIEKKQSKRNPYAPFTTSTLQQEASRKLGFSARQTMQVAQKLYEGINMGGETAGVITYMRTDGVTVATEAIMAARSLIEKQFGDNYLPKSPRMYQTKAKNAQEAHEAIRPTDPMRTPKAIKNYLSDEQFKLYDLIWKRLITSQMEAVVLDQVAADITTGDGYATLRATGSTIRFDGFYRLYREGKDDEEEEDGSKILPPLEEGEAAKLAKTNPAQHFTQPPPRFSEASLVKKLEELGIGRPSTYASIISVLQDREYVKIDKKRFIPEARGRLVTAFLSSFFPKYVEYDFTANLENELDNVSAGKLEWKKALDNFWGEFKANVDKALELDFTSVINELNIILEHVLFIGEGDLAERRKCPTGDGGELSLKLGKFGAFVGCSNYPECQYTRQLVTNSDDSGSTDDKAAAAISNEPKNLGTDPKTGKDITLRKGPYGFYVQIGEPEGKAKPKRASLAKGTEIESVDLAAALELLILPKELGMHPDTGKVVVANVGRYGPYVQHDGKFTSVKGDDDIRQISLERAVEIIKAAPVKKGAEPLRVLGKYPDTEDDIAVYDGRYGAYVKYQKINATIPKSSSIEAITLEEAVKLIDEQAAKKGVKTKKPVKKKAAAKKKPAKKKPAAKKK